MLFLLYFYCLFFSFVSHLLYKKTLNAIWLVAGVYNYVISLFVIIDMPPTVEPDQGGQPKATYKTVTGVNGPLVILDKVKVLFNHENYQI